jgi:hypothetical protein
MKHLIICLSFIVLASCASNADSPEAMAKTFCNCSEKFGTDIAANKEKKISDKEFEKSRMAWLKCMGPNDPRATMNPDEVLKFDEAFKKAILNKCPKTARNYGFN